MTRRTTTLIATVLWVVSVILVSVTLLFIARSSDSQVPAGFDTAGVGETVRYLAATTVGAILAARRPRNPIGWLVLAFGLSLVVYPFVAMYAATGLFVAPGRLPWIRQVAWVGNWVWVPFHACIALLLLLFPDGRLPSPRWRPVAWTIGVAGGLALVAAACYPGPLDVALMVKDAEVTARLTNPLGVAALGQLFEPFLLVLLLGAVVGAVALLLRFRRARGIERQQLKWVAYAALLFGIEQGGLVLGRLAGLVPDTGLPWLEVVTNFTFIVFFVAIAVAVLRYRLYEIDRLINRTLVYGLLTALLAAVYAGLVLVGGLLSGGMGGELPSWAVAGATLAVAALFRPARRRIQAVVDRRFNRRRYDAARTVEAFSARLRDEVDLNMLSAELLTVVDQTMQPTRASLWLRPSAKLPASGGGRGR
jgi:hypothetical protein